MKKKIFLMLAMVAVIACMLALAVSAESVHSGKVDLDATVTLDDGTVCNLFDSEGNALLWYISGTDENGKKIYTAIRSDDHQVKYKIESWDEVTETFILLDDGTKYTKSSYVVFNMLDDDVVANYGYEPKFGRPVNYAKLWLNYASNLEYVYLRLDTQKIQKESFKGCAKLKYINLEDLTELVRIGDGGNFSGCTSLFKGQVLDLSKTKLETIDNGGTFNGVPIIGIKFPSTLKGISTWSFQGTSIESIVWPMNVKTIESAMFKNNTALNSIYISNALTAIKNNVFEGVTTLEKIFYVGTKEEFLALLENVNTTSNGAFFDVLGTDNENLISYEAYMALDDKSGKYAVYGYSYCEAYNEGKHTLSGTAKLPESIDFLKDIYFVDTCTTCNMAIADEGSKIEALFVCKGISAKNFGDGVALVQGYELNTTAIEAYKSHVNDFDFGILAYANNGGNACQPKPGDDKVVDIVFDNMANNYIEVKLTGVPSEYKDIAVIFCVYVTEGDKVYYIDDGETLSSIVGKSYNNIVG